MSQSLDTIQPFDDDLIPDGEGERHARGDWLSPADRIARVSLGEQVIHWRTAWEVQTLKLEQAEKTLAEIESLLNAWKFEAQPPR